MNNIILYVCTIYLNCLSTIAINSHVNEIFQMTKVKKSMKLHAKQNYGFRRRYILKHIYIYINILYVDLLLIACAGPVILCNPFIGIKQRKCSIK